MHRSPREPYPRRRSGRVALALTLLLGLLHYTIAADLELAFCAPVGAWPMSSQERPGFDNQIAEILADELGATATFVWTNFDDVGIRDTLHAGLCDIAVGVGESVAETLSTVPYLTTPYVFVSLAARGLSIESLDDPQLTSLTIGTYQSGIPSIALRNRDIEANVREYAAIVRPTGADGHTPVLDAVLAGEVDVAIVYGPMAAARAMEEDVALTIEAVTPELDFGATILQLSRTWTIGVRTHDEALRDRLNRALAARWDDVMAVLDAYGVPQSPLSRPTDVEADLDATSVGVIFPARTPASLPNAPVGEDARLGVAVAENAVSLAADDAPFVVLRAHAPTLASVERAALRLILVEQVDALIGGYDSDEAHLLAQLAAEHDVVFFNVGAEDDALRDRACYPTTLHVAPSGHMLVNAIAATLTTPTSARVFAVGQRGTWTEALVGTLADALDQEGHELVDHALVEPGQFIFFPVFEQVRAADADVLVLLMDADAQETFLGQAASAGVDATVVGLSTVRGQSRPYLQRFLQVAPRAATVPRVVVWDPALDVDLNATFAARTAQPMEPAAWTTYAAIRSAFVAAVSGVLHDTDGSIAHLTDPTTAVELGKLTPARYRSTDGQLLQELYLVEPVAGAAWGRTASDRIATARVVDVLATDVSEPTVATPPEACTEQ